MKRLFKILFFGFVFLIGTISHLSANSKSKNAITVKCYLYENEDNLPIKNHPITIIPDITDTTEKYTVYTNNSGFFYLTFRTNTSNKSLITFKTICEGQTIKTTDTINIISGIFSKNYYVCHNPFWYIKDLIIWGQITDSLTQTPIANHTIIITSNNNIQTGHKIKTNSSGYYYDTVKVDITDSTNSYTVNTYTYCNKEIEFLFQLLSYQYGNYRKDFKICKNTETGWFLDFYFQINNYSKIVFFSELSSLQSDSTIWDFGDGSYGKGTTTTHNYSDEGSYKVIMTSYKNGYTKIFSKRIVIGTTISVRGEVLASGVAINNGYVVAYMKERNNFSVINFAKITDGSFTFKQILRGEYIFYAIPNFDIDTNYFPKYISTYNGNSLFWQDASTIQIGDYGQDISICLKKYTEIYWGSNIIKFKISPNILYKYDIASVLLFNSDFEAINSVPILKGSETSFFKNLPNGTYYLKVEIPGCNSNFIKIILTGDNNFIVNIFLNGNNIEYTVAQTELYVDTNIEIFPNPFTETLNIKSDIYPLDLKIYDTNGILIMSEIINENQTLQTNNIETGIYISVLSKDDNVISRKIIIKK